MRSLPLLVLLTTGWPALAGEYAVLTSGVRIRADRHETEAGKVRLYTNGGFLEMDEALIQSFEFFPDPPPARVENPITPPSVEAKPVLTPLELADAAADKYGLPRGLVRSVMKAESANRPDALSPKGAIGLMQLMPGTARDLGVDPADPAQNVDGGVRLLRDLLLKYDSRLWPALAAYNAGTGAVQKYSGVPPYRETVDYVTRIDRLYRRSQEPKPAVTANRAPAPGTASQATAAN